MKVLIFNWATLLCAVERKADWEVQPRMHNDHVQFNWNRM